MMAPPLMQQPLMGGPPVQPMVPPNQMMPPPVRGPLQYRQQFRQPTNVVYFDTNTPQAPQKLESRNRRVLNFKEPSH